MKWLWFFLAATVLGLIYFSEQNSIFERLLVYYRQSTNGKIWQSEVEKQRDLYGTKHAVVFLGDSHMEQCEWKEVFPDFDVANRGIPGETTSGLLKRLEWSLGNHPKLVFLQIGINDVFQNVEHSIILKNYKSVIANVQAKRAILVVTVPFYTRYNREANERLNLLIPELKTFLKGQKVDFLDLTNTLGNNQKLGAEFTLDGVHLNATGYKVWISKIDSCLRAVR